MHCHHTNPHILMIGDPGKVAAYSSVGSYPIVYLTNKSESLCATCVQGDLDRLSLMVRDDSSTYVNGHGANWENPQLTCSWCETPIECASEPEPSQLVTLREASEQMPRKHSRMNARAYSEGVDKAFDTSIQAVAELIGLVDTDVEPDEWMPKVIELFPHMDERIRVRAFQCLDERPGYVGYSVWTLDGAELRWHHKLRQVRNHHVWGPKLFATLRTGGA